MRYIIGIDIGTSGTKTVLFDEKLNIIAKANYDYAMTTPKPMFAEQDPQDWWDATVHGIKDVIKISGVGRDDIVGIGLSGQMHGLVLLDECGRVLMPSIIWCDQRTQAECEDINRLVGEPRLIEITANPAMTGFTASKILWVKKHCPDVYDKVRHILLPKDYIRYRLTGDFATDVSDASGMQLLDVGRREWSHEVLGKLSIDISLLPTVYESEDITGTVKIDVAHQLGLSEKCILVGGAGDQAAAAIGCGIVSEGNMSATIGSSGVLFAAIDKPIIDKLGRVHTLCHAVRGKWQIMSVTQSSGLAVKWLRDSILGNRDYRQMDELAAQISVGSEGLLFLPYLMGERSPILDPNAKGVLYGLTYAHTQAHIIRSVLEGVALSQRHCLNVMTELGLKPDNIVINGGGAKSALWREIIADCLGQDLIMLSSNEGGAMGVAILAGVASGIFASVSDATNKHLQIKQTTPHNNNHNYDDVFRRYAVLYQSIKGI